MSKSSRVALILLLAAACNDEGETLEPGENTRVEITSDPAGASIELNEVAIGRTTPSTISDIIGRQRILVRLERDGIAYGYRIEIDIRGDSLHRINGPLMFRCSLSSNPPCLQAAARDRELGRLRISTQANGALFMKSGTGQGLLWPVGANNSYSSVGMPTIAMLSEARDTLALGIYDLDYLAGRPEPVLTTTSERTTFRQSTWIIPPIAVINNNAPTVRGLEVEEELIGSPNSDVAFLKLTFRNITDRESYRAADPVVPVGGLQFDRVYLGFALDVDIGAPDDDMVTYEPGLEMVYIYDSNFHEEIFGSVNAGRPGLLGLKLVEAPIGAVAIALNAWPSTFGLGSGDWSAGTITEPVGFGILSGLRSFEPDHPGRLVGHTPASPNDYRMSVSAGPITLAPAQSASITVAIILAQPVAGEYTSGQIVAPGNPSADDRQIRRIAGTLLERAANLVMP